MKFKLEELHNGMILKDIIIVEGFEMVGKSTAIKNLFVKEGYTSYHATHDLTDITVGRNNSWTIGYGVLDFLKQYNQNFLVHFPAKVVIDRGIFSSYVYQKLYGPEGDLDFKILDYYANDEFFHNEITHCYVRPANKAVARMLWENSKNRPKNPNILSNKYDQFKTFEDYWEMYKKAEDLFFESYKIMKIKPYTIQVEFNGTYTVLSGRNN